MSSELVAMKRVPLWFKVGYSVWVTVWLVLYAAYYPTAHFLWMCHVGNVILVAAFWLESPLLFSWQAVALLLADLLWTFDLLTRITFGVHPLGATTYVFVEQLPIAQRLASMFHLAMPWILIWALWKFGYDRRAIWLQLAACWVLFPVSYLFGSEADDINWVFGPFNQVQHTLPPLLFLLVAMILYPIVVFLPSHLFFAAVVPRPRDRGGSSTRSPSEQTQPSNAGEYLKNG